MNLHPQAADFPVPALSMPPESRILASLLMAGAIGCAPPTAGGVILCVGLPCIALMVALRTGFDSFPRFLIPGALLAVLSGTILMVTGAGTLLFSTVGKALAGMVTALALNGSAGIGQIQEGLARFPLPSRIRLLAGQMLHQSGLLLDETDRIRRAIALRGGASGFRLTFLLVRTIPAVWLPRLLARADRLGMVMEARGFGAMPRGPWRNPGRDGALVLALSGCSMGAALLLRFGFPPV
ncbi:MAG: energy-coupling factor transporter transmembrane component T [Bacteroidota bacterium]